MYKHTHICTHTHMHTSTQMHTPHTHVHPQNRELQSSDFLVRPQSLPCSEYFRKSSETITRQGNRLLHTQEWETAEAERDRARHSTQRLQSADALIFINILLCTVHIYIANMQYIRNYHAAYKYTIQLAHTCPTMHRIRLVVLASLFFQKTYLATELCR